MNIIPITDIYLQEPTILDSSRVLSMQNEFFSTCCKFNGTCDLDKYHNYLDWLAHTINQRHSTIFDTFENCTKNTYLVSTINNPLIGMVEIIFYHNPETFSHNAHIIVCIRPCERRKGYGKPLLKKAIQECKSFGIKKENITFERNSKACNSTMSKIIDF